MWRDSLSRIGVGFEEPLKLSGNTIAPDGLNDGTCLMCCEIKSLAQRCLRIPNCSEFGRFLPDFGDNGAGDDDEPFGRWFIKRRLPIDHYARKRYIFN